MNFADKDCEIQISISGTFNIKGPQADYTQLLNGVCCAIAMDIDGSGNQKRQYLIASELVDNIKSTSTIFPPLKNISGLYRSLTHGIITNLYSLDCNVNIKKFTEYPYASTNKLSSVPLQRENTLKYFVGDNDLVKITYDLTVELRTFHEYERKELVSKRYSPLLLKIDVALIDYLKYLHSKTLGKPFDVKTLSRFIAENIKTLGGKELLMENPIMNKLNAAFENKLNINLNNVE